MAYNKPYAYLYKDPIIVAYQENLALRFTLELDRDIIPPPEQVSKIVCIYEFGVTPDRYFERDLTNMIKATEDAIFGQEYSVFPEYDDSLVTSILENKLISNTEYVSISVGFLMNGDNPIKCLYNMLRSRYGQYIGQDDF